MASARDLDPETFLGLLDDAQRRAIEGLGTQRDFARGAVLMYEGEPGERVMILESGHVKVTRLEPSGHETMLTIRDPGDVVGEVSLIDERPRMATVVALGPVRALVIASSVFRAHLEHTPGVAVALLAVETRWFRDTTTKLAQFSASDTVGRLAARIVELSDRYGTARDGVIEIGISLSQAELAAWTGASRAGVAKAFQTLRDLGWIETYPRRLVVREAQALRARAA